MSLIVHCGAEHVDYTSLRSLTTPEGTDTHVPIAHHAVVDMVKYSLGFFGHEVIEEHHAITPDGMRYFGVLKLLSEYGDYVDIVGLRNSHDRKFPIGISMGSQVIVCDNLAFCGDHVIKRKHTAKAKRDLPGLVAEVIEPLRENRLAQHRVLSGYKETPLLESEADRAIMQLYRRRVINVTTIAAVVERWENPPFDWGPKSAWRLFNATTHALEGRVAENPTLTRELHTIIDGVCAAG